MAEGVRVDFLSHYRRVFPLARGMKEFPANSLIHLHWPEAYMGVPGQRLYPFRQARFPYDLMLASRERPLVVTAHNIQPHNGPRTQLLKQNLKARYERADGVIVHSQAASDQLSQEFDISLNKMRVIRHGEVSELIENLPTRENAAESLGRSTEEPVCLMFGAVSPYKGIEGVLEFWKVHQPECRLVIVGKPDSIEYGDALRKLTGEHDRITFRLEFVTDLELRQWLSMADCCLYNYQQILTSGSVHPPRALGIPILLPERFTTLDLGEPCERVLRFSNHDTLGQELHRALAMGVDYDSAHQWRQDHDWSSIAEKTKELYEQIATVDGYQGGQ